MNAGWIVLMEVMRGLQSQPYVAPVRIKAFHALCYVVTEMGVPTGFNFEESAYGPFSRDVKQALHDFANRNWLQQEQLGRMMALRAAPGYAKDRGRFRAQIKAHQKKIDKAVDLFSRIKNTGQAEEVMMVLYASRQLKQDKPGEEVSEQELFDYILDWKKSWDRDDKKQAVAEAIRNLVLLGWMRARISESLLEAA